MPLKLANNAVSRLSTSLSAGSTTLGVMPGDGTKFPAISAGDWCPLTIIKADGTLEIVKATARTIDTFTISRAQEGTVATDFAAGDRIELRFTKGAINDIEQRITDSKAQVDHAILSYQDYSAASSAAATLPDGQVVEAPDADGRASRFKVLSSALVFVEFVNALAQAVGFTETADPEVFKALLLDTRCRQIKLKPGNYDGFNGQTLLIRGRNHSSGGGEVGEFFVDMTGVNLSGTGLILIDSSKKVHISGLRAPGWDIEYRGVWWTVLDSVQFRDHIIGRAGTSFSNNYWNYGFNVLLQRVLIPEDAVGVNNSFEWAGTMRGDNGQSFISTRAVAFEFLGNVNCQHWRFRGDISYHSQAVYVVGAGNTTGDVELEMDGYFDSVIPLTYNRAGVKIIANGHHANGAGLNISHEAATRNSYRLERQDRSLIHNPASGINQVPNGDLSITVPSGHPLMPVTTGGTVSAQFVSGNSVASRAFLEVTRSDSGSVSFKTLQAMTAGRYTGRWVARLPDGAEPRDVQFRVGSRYFTTQLTSTQWHVATLTEETPSTAGVAPPLTFNAVDGAAITIRFAYIGLTYGAGGAMYERSVQPQTLIGELVTAIPTTAANATTLITVPCQGATPGDFVQWSCTAGVGSWLVSANIASANEVRIYLRNTGGSELSIASATWRVRVTKPGM